jgi:hypothetical protein
MCLPVRDDWNVSVANPQSLFGGPELILVAAIVLLLAVAPFLFERGRVREWTDTAWSREYLDRLFGRAKSPGPGAASSR